VISTAKETGILNQLFGSRLRAQLLTWLYTHPGESFYIRQLESSLGEDSTNISRELRRLHQMGIVSGSVRGNQKHYTANRDFPAFEELRSLVIKLGVVDDVLRAALDPVSERIAVAFIYGSFSTGFFDRTSDLDVMVVGDVRLSELAPQLREVARTIGRELNASCYSRTEFRQKADERGFVWRIAEGPKTFVIGGADELGVLVGERMD
jgi:predicted nucleotidyltransferase